MPSSEPDFDAASVRPFGDFLTDLNRGAVADKCALQLAQLVTKVRETHRKGTLTLTIQVATYKGNDSAVEVTADTNLKLPQGDPHAGIFFPDSDGQLFRDDPQQMAFALPLADVPARERPLA